MRIVIFLSFIICGVYIASEFLLDNFVRNLVEKKSSKIVERKVTLNNLKINFLNKEIILEDINIANNNNFKGNLLKIKKIKILVNVDTAFNETVEAKLVEIDGIDFYYQVLIKDGKIIDNLSLINQALKKTSQSKTVSKKIYPPKKKDKNFIIKKLFFSNSKARVISDDLKINTNTNLGDMEFTNVGNSKDANHFKDIFAMILTNVISKVQNDILTQKIKQKFKNELKNIKKDFLKDILKGNQKDLFKKFDKLLK